jgi:hypothetical protein
MPPAPEINCSHFGRLLEQSAALQTIHEASAVASPNGGSLARKQLFDMRLTNLDDPDSYRGIKAYMY